ncbi:YceI family protein [Hyalangium sp.]|uniref:YceI family protein n=1 Tax=Hyalangium sp. TaxID=2028555 RepID=UPI002D531B51|nr:YceI family protein [Hyalangium sp.]HYH95349.1 YceI family protein [Hyalangium sp.]
MFVRLAALCLVSLLPLTASAQTAPAANAKQTFVFNDLQNRDTVTFLLDAPLEVINGLSNRLTGTIVVEGNKASGKLAVPVSSIKTGNESRDGHLQNDKWLDAAKYPDIIVEFKDLALPSTLESGKPLKLQTKARFSLHGVTREEPVEITASYMKESEDTKKRAPGDLLRLRAKFQIPLESYKINRTGVLILKVAEVADVSVDAWGSTQFKL